MVAQSVKKYYNFHFFGENVFKKVAIGTTFAVEFNKYLALDERQ